MLYAVNPADGSLLLWSLEHLDTFSPLSFGYQRQDRRLVGDGAITDFGPSGLPAPVDGSPAVLQVQLSFTSRIPNALAPSDAATLALSDSAAVFHVLDWSGSRAIGVLVDETGSQKQLALLSAPTISLALLQADGCLGIWQMSFDRSANHFEDFIRTFNVTLPQGTASAPLQASDFAQITRICGHKDTPIVDVLLVPSQPVLVSRAGPSAAASNSNTEVIVWTIEREKQFLASPSASASASKDAASSRQKELDLVQLTALTLADLSSEFDQIVVLPALFNGNSVLFPAIREQLVPLGSGFVFIRVFIHRSRLLVELYFCLLNAGVLLDDVYPNEKRRFQSLSMSMPRPVSLQSGVSPAAVFFLHSAVLLDPLPRPMPLPAPNSTPASFSFHSPHVFAVHNALGSSAPLRPCDLRVVDLTAFAADIDHLPDSFLLLLLESSSSRVRALTWHLQLTTAAAGFSTAAASVSRLLACKFQQVI